MVTLAGLGFADTAFSSDEIEAPNLKAPTPPNRRAEGLAHYDLPMQLRARFDVTYWNDFYASDALARPYVSATGPRIERNQSLESRVALTRAFSDRVEIGIVFGTRSPVGQLDLLDFERQTVGAMIRIVP